MRSRLRLISGVAAAAMAFSLAACGSDSDSDADNSGGSDSLDGLSVALVTRITEGSWYETYYAALKSEVEAFGGKLQVFDSQNDLAKMATNVETAVAQQPDILLINNGTAEALDSSVQQALDAEIPVVTYDSDIALDGVTAIAQDDHALATNGLQALSEDLDGQADIVVLTVAGFTPLDNRLAAVNEFVTANPGIKVLEQTGTVDANSALSTQANVSALLTKHAQPGQIDAIWSHWNEFTYGAFEALKEAGRNDVPVYTVDLTDRELPFFWDEGVNFQAASATNPATIGRSQVRLAYQKVHGDAVPATVTVPPALVRKSDLPETEIPWSELPDVVPAWNADTTDWPQWLLDIVG